MSRWFTRPKTKKASAMEALDVVCCYAHAILASCGKQKRKTKNSEVFAYSYFQHACNCLNRQEKTAHRAVFIVAVVALNGNLP
ncbi:hypothetical protein A10D4_07805 [Idiomarina xiamenensis 10-D-4]|uniref:Uncharacterized protein n=1 Tax=Idiomarina xiamenensis 10-D-4 TaxID=740709 RepID=K2JJY4_9GAMM|nr:hypothetical protein A10D4_07805 [Idiomarina xiamenensis 10-D-4]